MKRTFACLAAALALLSFTGCGDPPNAGVAVAANTGPLKPIPPLPEDQNTKITPPPLVPSALPAIEAPLGDQPPTGQSTTSQPVTGSTPAAAQNTGNPAATAPSATAQATPPANGGGLLDSLFGNKPTTKTPNAAPSNEAAQIVLSNAEFLRANKGKIHIEVNYVFVQGAPKPTNWYTVVLRERGNAGAESQHGNLKVEGKDLHHSGKFEGDVNIGGRSPAFGIHITEATSRDESGHQISEVVEAGIRRDLGRPSGIPAPADDAAAPDPSAGATAPAAAPPAAAPASGGAGLLDSLFGNKPTEKTPPASNAPSAPSNGNNAPGNPPANLPGNGAGNTPADAASEIALSGVTVGRNQGGQVHFLAAYVFTRGQPVASNWYTVVVQDKAGRGRATPAGEMKFEGSKLQQRGDLEGNVTMGGNGRDFDVRIMEGTSRDDKGRLISNVGVGEIHHVVNGQDIGHPERAAPGVGAQGKDYGPGLVTTPISAYFAAKQLIVFTIQIPNAMKFFKASNNRDPNSQEEFMEKIVKDNGITLPELPAGERYVYDPHAGELMVEHPKK